jgi:hypothetical protein
LFLIFLCPAKESSDEQTTTAEAQDTQPRTATDDAVTAAISSTQLSSLSASANGAKLEALTEMH